MISKMREPNEAAREQSVARQHVGDRRAKEQRDDPRDHAIAEFVEHAKRAGVVRVEARRDEHVDFLGVARRRQNRRQDYW